MADVRQQLDELRNWRESGMLTAALAIQRLGYQLAETEVLLRSKESDLARLDRLKTVGGQADLVQRTDRGMVAREAERIRTCGTELLHASTSEVLGGWRRHRWKDVPEAGKALEAAFQRAWSDLCNETFGESERLARVLKRLEPTKELGERMLGAATTGLKLREVYPPGRREREEFASAVQTCSQCRNELSSIGGASGLAELLLKAADGKATLADLSPELRQWLSDNKVLTAFRLTLA